LVEEVHMRTETETVRHSETVELRQQTVSVEREEKQD